VIFVLDDDTSVISTKDGGVLVTKPNAMGKLSTHMIRSPYTAFNIAGWLYNRSMRRAALIQDAFPDMKDEDREFLVSGITPAQWAAMFPPEAEISGEE